VAVEEIIDDLKRECGIACDIDAIVAVGGGSINQAFRIQSSRGPLLLKVNSSDRASMFEAEAAGLAELGAAAAVSVPTVYACGRTERYVYLALQWIEFSGISRGAETTLGRELARQHAKANDLFGWQRDNTIGLTPQPNTPTQHWVDFFREFRLGFQLELAADNGLPAELQTLANHVLERLEAFLAAHTPRPSLLHGDLWGGNWGATKHGVPYIFDPAVYYGDRETDLAMTRLFGGFGPDFYRAYAQAWPLATGWEARVPLYNLYHLLNHFNLFGGGYLPQVSDTLRRLRDLA